jgi:hypothetical protein
MSQSSVAFVARREDPTSPEGQLLLDELSAILAVFSGDGGQSRFRLADFRASGGTFYIAPTALGEPLGCGAFWHSIPAQRK